MSINRSRLGPRLVSKVPRKEKLPWLGLKAVDRLSRIVTAAVKEAREAKYGELRAKYQIAQVLDSIPAERAMALFLLEISRRGRHIPRIAYNLLEIF
jgi:hypothetical protein